ncbi:type VII secretion-associated protein [Mycobacterium sp.]|uniref:type VII secretion-associated protein n=1 Tax=Mycobacterium sp. TaxID=1785 RepID=UPI003D6A3D2E
MSPRSTVIEAGPATIRQLTCGEASLVDPELVTAAVDGIDDPVALVDARPVSVDALLRAVLQSMGCQGRLILIHPSWWAATRVERVGAAARDVADRVEMRPRSWLLARATPAEAASASVIVEITDRIVVVTGTTAVVAKPRRGEPGAVAGAVMQAIAAMTAASGAAVLIDAPVGVGGAGALAAMIADLLRSGADRAVVIVDDARLRRLATAAVSGEENTEPPSVDTTRRRHWALLLLAVLIAAAVWANPFGRHGAPAADRTPTTFLVEGRVAVEVPAHWPTQRVIVGPGSRRVQVTSPSDPQVALHVTQSPVVAQTLADAAESLKHAIDAEPPGVFVDFNPSGSSASRPAVTYREVRAGHDIRWAVVLDRAVRIGIGCQSRPGDDNAVREACELAVRSARAVG